jgi:alpha-glucosidase
VIVDWVASHTSDQHPWFQAALCDPMSVERGFYHFASPAPDGTTPNNWSCAFEPGTPSWSRAANSDKYYLHSFLPQQPDLNWHNPLLVERMHATLRFWLDRGVDGFRADVVHNLCKDATLADVDPSLSAVPHMLLNDQPETHARLRDIRKLLDSYPGGRAMVGEIFLLDSAKVASFYGDNDELHMAFNFMPLYAPWDADAWKNCIRDVQANHDPRNAWPTWVLSNHDQRRHRSRYGGGEAEARAAALLLLTLRGTPFVYQGEELGLLDADVPLERAVDPGGRDGSRAPIPWTAEQEHGWSQSPWLPLPPESDRRNVETLRSDPTSILHLYRELLALRKEHPALQRGSLAILESNADQLVFVRTHENHTLHVLVNFSHQPQAYPPGSGRRMLITTDPALRAGEEFNGVLGPLVACVLL